MMNKVKHILALLYITTLITGLAFIPVYADEVAQSDEPIIVEEAETDGAVVTEEENVPDSVIPEIPAVPVEMDSAMEDVTPVTENNPVEGTIQEQTPEVLTQLQLQIPPEYEEYLTIDGFSYKDGVLYFHNLRLNTDGMYEITDEDGNVWYYDPLDPEFLRYFGEEAGEADSYAEPETQHKLVQGSATTFQSGINGQQYSYPSYVNGKEVADGIDVSYFQQSINWTALASSGVKFAIIRAGYRGYGEAGNMKEDPMCHTYIDGAYAAGIKVGIYFLSQARNRSEAEAEANKCAEIINAYKDKISLPVFMDYEYAGDPGRLYNQHQQDMNSGADYRSIHTQVVNTFCSKMSSYGYSSGIYCNRNMLESQLYVSSIPSDYRIWLANYTNSTPYSDRLDCWQYTSSYTGFRSSGAVGSDNTDLDFWFGPLPGSSESSVNVPTVSYRTHVQNIGWQSYRSNGEVAGTSGRSLRLEGINIKISGKPTLGVQYTTHCQDYGWLAWSSNDEMSGTEGEAKRLEAIKIQLTGSDKNNYDIYYRVHAQDVGWMGWAKNGYAAGTAGYSRRLEAIQIVLLKKGAYFNSNVGGIASVTSKAYIDKENGNDPLVPNSDIPNVSYRTHVQNVGWQAWKANGGFAGTSGRSLRLEGIQINLSNKPCSGGIRYKTHVQNDGWQEWKYDGKISGTSGRSLRLEAINIELTGSIANYYDIYYRVHAQDVGWMGWAKNGESAGTSGYSRRLEGIQIVIVPKGSSAPGSSYSGISQNFAQPYLSR